MKIVVDRYMKRMMRQNLTAFKFYDHWATASWNGQPVHEAVDQYNGKIVKSNPNNYKRLVFSCGLYIDLSNVSKQERTTTYLYT